MFEALKEEFYRDWVSTNGLALLGKGHKENDNGILFLAYFLYLVPTDKLDLDATFRVIKSLEVEPGVFARHPNNQMLEAHDNYVGICALSVLFNFSFAREIVEYGTKTGFSYNNLDTSNQQIRTTRQGGEIAFYKLCCSYVPTVWELVWLVGGIAVAGFKGDHSTTILSWLRLEAIKRKDGPRPQWVVALIGAASLLFSIGVKKKWGNIKEAFKKYFVADHPINRAWSLK